MLGRNKWGARRERAQGLPELVAEIGEQREASRRLVERFEKETATTRGAIQAAARAREERDEYRRVLAAAIGGERREVARVEALEAERVRLQQASLATARELGAAAAERERAQLELRRLERDLEQERAERVRALADAADRAWTEREATRAEWTRLVATAREDSQVTTAQMADEVRAAIVAAREQALAAEVAARPDPAAALTRVRGLRARLCIGLAGVTTLIGVALAPMALLGSINAERGAFVQLATHVTPGTLVIATVAAFASAVGLLTLARRDLTPSPLGAPATTGSAAAPSGETRSREARNPFVLPRPKADAPPSRNGEAAHETAAERGQATGHGTEATSSPAPRELRAEGGRAPA